MAYGFQVFNANGTSEIFGYNASGSHFLASGVGTVPANSYLQVSAEGMTSSNTSTVGLAISTFNVSALSTTRHTGFFRIHNSTGTAAVNVGYYAMRF